MNLIIPMAGWGSRLRPHTLSVPKPMIKIVGKSIVEHLIDNIYTSIDTKLESISFIIRADFGKKIEDELQAIALKYNTKAEIFYQNEPLGTAHAVYCAKSNMIGNVIIGFADTMFDANFDINPSSDAIVWVKKIENPESFGVVKTDEKGVILSFIEKPKEFISDLAIIGVYYFKDAKILLSEIESLFENDIKHSGEYQLTNCLESMKNKGLILSAGKVNKWLDCGNKEATIDSNLQLLSSKSYSENIDKSLKIENSTIISPCFIDQNVTISNSVVGPFVSIGKNTSINNSVINNSIIQDDSTINSKLLNNSMIGSKVKILGKFDDLSVGDYNEIK